jgi:Ca2+-binding EF-hand superfamily protein
MKTNEISVEDVYNVANDLGIDINQDDVNKVLELYDDELDIDPTATWDLIIENILYKIK